MPIELVELVDPYGNPDDSPERIQEKIDSNAIITIQNEENESINRKVAAVLVNNFAGQNRNDFMRAMVGNNPHQIQRMEARIVYEVTAESAQRASEVAGAGRAELDRAQASEQGATVRAEVGEGKFAKSLIIRAELEQYIIDNGWPLPNGQTAADFPDGIPGGSGRGNQGEPPIDDVTPGDGGNSGGSNSGGSSE